MIDPGLAEHLRDAVSLMHQTRAVSVTSFLTRDSNNSAERDSERQDRNYFVRGLGKDRFGVRLVPYTNAKTGRIAWMKPSEEYREHGWERIN